MVNPNCGMNKRQKIGWLVLCIAILFMLWRLPRLHGQGFGSFSHDQPFLAKDATASSGVNLETKLLLHWVYTNAQYNGAGNRLTNWTDIVGGISITNGGTEFATNGTTSGIKFYGSGASALRYYNNSPPLGTNIGAGFIVAKWNAFGLNPEYIFQVMDDKTASPGAVAGSALYLIFRVGATTNFSLITLGATNNEHIISDALVPNRFYDVLISSTKTNFSAPDWSDISVYIDGVLTTNWTGFRLNPKADNAFRTIGFNGGNSANSMIKDLFFWTNLSSTLAPDYATALHYYRTNLYGSP